MCISTKVFLCIRQRVPSIQLLRQMKKRVLSPSEQTCDHLYLELGHLQILPLSRDLHPSDLCIGWKFQKVCRIRQDIVREHQGLPYLLRFVYPIHPAMTQTSLCPTSYKSGEDAMLGMSLYHISGRFYQRPKYLHPSRYSSYGWPVTVLLEGLFLFPSSADFWLLQWEAHAG